MYNTLRTTTRSVLGRTRHAVSPALSPCLSSVEETKIVGFDDGSAGRRIIRYSSSGSGSGSSVDASTTATRRMSTALKPATPRFESARVDVQRSTAAVSITPAAPLLKESHEYVPSAYSTQQDFPSLVIGGKGKIEPQGTFAEAQAEYLHPDPDDVESLSSVLAEANMGVVAHYYMDVELQGVLDAVRTRRPGLVSIADSLAMGDAAVQMVRDGGVSSIACLGVDFMAESVAAVLSKNGLGHVPVYRARSRPIGCSLAESAEREDYRAWLQRAAETGENALHVVYINTSLRTKAVSAATVPTITCTSSNVLRTVLQASSQVEDLRIYYGPDTYMGNNLVTMLNCVLDGGWTDERIARELHPAHDRDSLRRLADEMRVYPNGNCVVHHMFGGDVVQLVKDRYDDAYVTAHLEVPGEMFEIAMAKSLDDKGTVGSTSDILKFISRKVEEARDGKIKDVAVNGDNQGPTRLKFVLGTEAGMVTSIVRSVQDILASKDGNSSNDVEAEIIFPVASDAVATVEDDDLALVPGVRGGEGCSTAGGCATCPFMKMNDLDALSDVAATVARGDAALLKGHLPPARLEGRTIGGRSATELGVEPIVYMRDMMRTGRLSDELVEKIYGGVSQ